MNRDPHNQVDPKWTLNRVGRLTMTFGDFLLGQYTLEIVRLNPSRFIAQIRTPDQCRFDSPTVYGQWKTEEEARGKALPLMRSLPWCPSCIREPEPQEKP